MDDKFYLEAPEVRNPSWASMKTFFGEVLNPSVVKGYYQPLALTSIMVDFLDPMAGKDLRPFHRTSLILHTINVALISVLLYLLFGNWLISCLVGLLYGVHPLNADVVLWVAERKAVLSTFFALLTMLLYLLYVRHMDQTRHRNWKLYGASLLMYVCAVLSKPTAVPVAALLLVLDYWPLLRLSRNALLEKIPFFIICGFAAIVSIISQTRSFDAGNVVMMHSFYIPFVVAYSIGLYLFKTIWPTGIVYDYPFPQPFSCTNPELLMCVTGAAAVFVTIAFSARRTRVWLAIGLFFFIAISPALGVIRFTSSVVSNRFMYLPMVGLLLPLCWSLNRLWDKDTGAWKVSYTRAALVGTTTVLVIGCACATRTYESKWSDTLTLLQYYLSRSPNDWKLHTRLGNEWIERGNYGTAIDEFAKAVHLNPEWAENHLNLGRALFTIGSFQDAQMAFSAALGLTPNDWRGHELLGLTLVQQNYFEDGLKELETAAQLAPNQAEVHCAIANILIRQGKPDEAVKEYKETLRINPHFREAKNALDSISLTHP